jgi:hypothetical protein
MPRGVYERYDDADEAAQARLQKKVRAWVLRDEGYTFLEISELMGISASHAYDLAKEMQSELEIPPEEEVIKQTLSRYDGYLRRLTERMESADDKALVALVAQCSKLEKDRRDLLGYAKPVKVHLTNDSDRSAAEEKYAELIALERVRIQRDNAERDAGRRGSEEFDGDMGRYR